MVVYTHSTELQSEQATGTQVGGKGVSIEWADILNRLLLHLGLDTSKVYTRSDTFAWIVEPAKRSIQNQYETFEFVFKRSLLHFDHSGFKPACYAHGP
jgi:hypothetical protein